MEAAPDTEPRIAVRHLDMAFGGYVVQRDVSFTVGRGEIFVIMGGSGCGKSTMLKHMIGLIRPARGDVFYDGESFWNADPDRQMAISRRFGVLFQSGALWSSMTLAQNVALPLSLYTTLDARETAEVVALKLALVGLRGFEDYYPSEISGGMRKRAGLARAMALDPDILFLDEPSAGLDPLSSRRLDDLILELRDNLGSTVVIVTHELPSIFAIADNSVFLDAETRTAIAHGNPRYLVDHADSPKVREFLRRGETVPA
jgi:ABC-type transport system involved in resistance to organic solvents, ATPase component